MYNVGITGAREYPIEVVEKYIYIYKLNFGKELRLITGACIGVDSYAAQIGCSHMIDVHTIVPDDTSRVDANWEVYCTSHEIMPKGSTYKDRNQKIVSLSEELIAFPRYPELLDGETTRSGTWQTVRMARKKKIQILEVNIRERYNRNDEQFF
jgi:hypothetical protein